MSDLLAWLFSVFGFTYIVVYSKIFFKFRDWSYGKSQFLGDLVHCPLCLGFWVGLAGHFAMFSPTHNILFDGCLGSIASWVGTILIADLQYKFEVHSTRTSCKTCGSQQPPAQ